MFGKRIIGTFGVLLMAGMAFGRVSQEPKAYELFSWKEKGHWHYALLEGKDRQRTYDEITSTTALRVGTPKLESHLKRLPRGTEVFWQADAPAGTEQPSTKQAKSFKHPSRK